MHAYAWRSPRGNLTARGERTHRRTSIAHIIRTGRMAVAPVVQVAPTLQTGRRRARDARIQRRKNARMKALLLGIDIGTYSSKAALVTTAGEVLRTAVVPHGISTPAPGHVEQDADGVWWHDLCALCRQLLDAAPYRGEDVAAVAVSA